MLRDPSGRDQGRQGADDRGRRHGRSPAQPVMSPDARQPALVAAGALDRRALRRPAPRGAGGRRLRLLRLRQRGRPVAHGLPIVHQDIVRTSPWPRAAADLDAARLPRVAEAARRDRARVCPGLAAADGAAAGGRRARAARSSSSRSAARSPSGSPSCSAARLFEAPAIALWGAALVATSPVFLYQLMNAMSDVPVTAAWTLALVLAVAGSPLACGIAAERRDRDPAEPGRRSRVVVMAWIGIAGAASGASASGDRRRSAERLAPDRGVARFSPAWRRGPRHRLAERAAVRIAADVRLRQDERLLLVRLSVHQRASVRGVDGARWRRRSWRSRRS